MGLWMVVDKADGLRGEKIRVVDYRQFAAQGYGLLETEKLMVETGFTRYSQANRLIN
jgi:hypothetical protein